MKSKQHIQLVHKKAAWLIKSLVCIGLLLFSLYANSQTLAVIRNEKGAPAELKMTELKSIFMGEKQRWRNGNKITIALMKTNTPAGASTCKIVYDMSSDDVKKFWLALVFQGKSDGPQFFNSVEELQSFVAENPGAIGIVDQSKLDADSSVVLVDGKKTL